MQKEEDRKTQSYLWDVNVVGMSGDGQESYYLQDDLGSPMLLTDEQGQIRESYAFDEYGQALHPTPGAQLQPLGYTGYQLETTSGLYFAQARRYDAGAGRFVSEDKIPGFTTRPHTMNRYSYCWNQPMEHVDLNGKFPLGVVEFIEKLMNYALRKSTELADNLSKIEEKQIAEYTAAVYLVNRDGALGQGHAALLLVREDGQAEFYSYAGRVNPGAVTIGCEGYLSTHLDEDGNPATIYTLNEYGYCWNNPIKFVDNNGEWATIVIGAIVRAIIGGELALFQILHPEMILIGMMLQAAFVQGL